MKVRNLFILFMLVSFAVFAQKVNVPKKVTDAFAKMYPKVTDVKWDKESAKEYEADFKDGEVHTTASFAPNGKFLESEVVIPVADAPKAALDFIAKKHADHKIAEVAKTTDAKGKIVYEIVITKDKSKKELVFDKHGKQIVKKEKKEKED